MPRHRILLVDDTATNRVLQRTVLEAAGYEVEEATTGAEALERLQGQPFDLMILDLLLPEMDGFEVLEAWRGLSRPGEMPILVMSALGDEEARIGPFAWGPRTSCCARREEPS
jgi:two-component system chemotaxis sensor kinase CheA